MANLVFGWLAAAEAYVDYEAPLALFGLGLVFFTVHFLTLRGYFALERTRTVFWIQCVVAATNIALAVTFAGLVSADRVAAGLVLAYVGSYVVGAAVSYSLLRRHLGGLDTRRSLRFLARLVVATAGAAGVALAVRYGVSELWPAPDSKLRAVTRLVLLAGVDVTVFLVLARLLRLREVTGLVGIITARFAGRSAGTP